MCEVIQEIGVLTRQTWNAARDVGARELDRADWTGIAQLKRLTTSLEVDVLDSYARKNR